MTSNEQFLSVNMTDSVSDAIPDEEEVIAVIMGMREKIETLMGLISHENKVVDNLFEILTTLSKPLKHINVDLSIIPVETGEVEKANISYDGKLVIRRKDAGIQIINLMDSNNRDLLTKVLANVLPKMMELINDPLMRLDPEIQGLESVIQELEDKPEVKIPMDIASVKEPESKLELEPFIFKETVIEPKFIVPKIENIAVEQEPKQVISKVLSTEISELELKLKSGSKGKKLVVNQLPKRGEKPLRKLRSKVEKQNEVVQRQMDIIKVIRDNKIKILRKELMTTEPEWEEEKGIISKLRKIFKNLGFG
jgi:hypothetical protein